MWPYWLMFLVPAFVATHEVRARQKPRKAAAALRVDRAWLAVAVIITLLVGYRLEVGGDWDSYIRNLEMMRFADLGDAIAASDPGYRVVEWLSLRLDWGVYGVNLIAGGVFAGGLAVFCRNMPRPWLSLSVAIPYVVVVVGMGYTRQASALGLAMLGLVALQNRSVRAFIAFVLLAATFHKSAVLLLPIAALAATRQRVWIAVWVVAATVLAYFTLLDDSVDHFYSGYIEAEMQSEGAQIRLLMNALPAALLLLYRRRFEMTVSQNRLWALFAAISVGLFILLQVTPYSTAIDRMALYLLPLQLVVFSYLPEVLGGRRNSGPVAVGVLAYYALVLFVWLTFATHAFAWVPYRFYPFELLF